MVGTAGEKAHTNSSENVWEDGKQASVRQEREVDKKKTPHTQDAGVSLSIVLTSPLRTFCLQRQTSWVLQINWYKEQRSGDFQPADLKQNLSVLWEPDKLLDKSADKWVDKSLIRKEVNSVSQI